MRAQRGASIEKAKLDPPPSYLLSKAAADQLKELADKAKQAAKAAIAEQSNLSPENCIGLIDHPHVSVVQCFFGQPNAG